MGLSVSRSTRCAAAVLLAACSALVAGCTSRPDRLRAIPPLPAAACTAPHAARVAVPQEFRTLDDVRRGLAALEAGYVRSGDGRGPFATAYVVSTAAIAQDLDDGRFEDRAWSERYLVAFANLYRYALERYEAGDLARCPPAWRAAFDAAASGRASPLENLLLGMNAHIRRDLPFALHEAGLGTAPARRYADHAAFDDAMAMAIDPIQERIACLYAPDLGIWDRALGPLDEAAALCGISRVRRRVWRDGVALAHAPTKEHRDAVACEIESRAAAKSRRYRALRLVFPRMSSAGHARAHRMVEP